MCDARKVVKGNAVNARTSGVWTGKVSVTRTDRKDKRG